MRLDVFYSANISRYRMLDASAHVLVFPLWEVGILCDAIQVFFYSVILDGAVESY
jgi:hypothetical protein